ALDRFRVDDQAFRQLVSRSPAAVIIDDGVACDLIEPRNQTIAILQRVDLRMDLKKDLLKDVFGVVWIIYPPADEAQQGLAEFFPDFGYFLFLWVILRIRRVQ